LFDSENVRLRAAGELGTTPPRESLDAPPSLGLPPSLDLPPPLDPTTSFPPPQFAEAESDFPGDDFLTSHAKDVGLDMCKTYKLGITVCSILS